MRDRYERETGRSSSHPDEPFFVLLTNASNEQLLAELGRRLAGTPLRPTWEDEETPDGHEAPTTPAGQDPAPEDVSAISGEGIEDPGPLPLQGERQRGARGTRR